MASPTLPLVCHVCSNMKPVRVILEAKADYTRSGISSLFPYLPGKASSKVAAVAARFSLSSRAGSPASTRSFQLDPEIARILNFPPLLKAFSDFCRRALCGEVSGNSAWFRLGFVADACSLDNPATYHGDVLRGSCLPNLGTRNIC